MIITHCIENNGWKNPSIWNPESLFVYIFIYWTTHTCSEIVLWHRKWMIPGSKIQSMFIGHRNTDTSIDKWRVWNPIGFTWLCVHEKHIDRYLTPFLSIDMTMVSKSARDKSCTNTLCCMYKSPIWVTKNNTKYAISVTHYRCTKPIRTHLHKRILIAILWICIYIPRHTE